MLISTKHGKKHISLVIVSSKDVDLTEIANEAIQKFKGYDVHNKDASESWLSLGNDFFSKVSAYVKTIIAEAHAKYIKEDYLNYNNLVKQHDALIDVFNNAFDMMITNKQDIFFGGYHRKYDDDDDDFEGNGGGIGLVFDEDHNNDFIGAIILPQNNTTDYYG